MNDSKNDIAWQKIFDKHGVIPKILANKYFVINSNDINEFREARLMTKFDHKSQLPKLFSDNNFSILPISRGSYIIADIDTFHSLNNDEIVDIMKIDFPNYLQSLDFRDITSESTAINCAFVSKILQDFTGEEQLYPTVSGRMSSSAFEFGINSLNGIFKVKVENSQMEIDGGYEGDKSLTLIEAKNYLSNDFLIRQLYYPYRLWKSKIDKDIRTIFLTYTNGIFHLREYLFEELSHYNSLKLVQQKKYLVREGAINLESIQTILFQTRIVSEPQIAFPQADSFERVINLCELLKEKLTIIKEDITSNYDFNERQTNYYSDAARYLGLVDKKTDNNQIVFFLTQKGNQVFNLPIEDRQIEFAKLILAHAAFKQSLELYFNKGELPSREEIIQIMKESNLYKVQSDKTFHRRASTVRGWINWIMNLIEE